MHTTVDDVAIYSSGMMQLHNETVHNVYVTKRNVI